MRNAILVILQVETIGFMPASLQRAKREQTRQLLRHKQFVTVFFIRNEKRRDTDEPEL